MKKLFKKIGIIGLIIGVLSPFITLPKVNAANSNDGCDHYLNQYLFLSVSTADGFYDFKGGYSTYTSFHYNFPQITANQALTIENIREYPIDTLNKLETYHGQVKLLLNDTDRSIKNIEKEGTWTEQTYTSGNYESVTSFLHGNWAEADETVDSAGWEINDDYNDFKSETFQGILLEQNKLNKIDLDVKFGGAIYNSNKKTFSSAGTYTTDLKEYLQKIVNDVNSNNNDSLNAGYIYKNGDNTYLNFRINRTLSVSDMNELNFGVYNTDTKYVWSTTNDPDNITNSYTAYIDYMIDEEENSKAADGVENFDGDYCVAEKKTCYQVPIDNKEDIDFDVKYQYYWPVILDVEYKVCNTATSNTWTLTYNENVDDITTVKNMPSPKTVSNQVGDSITLSTTKPEREGYTFKGWCTKDKSVCKQPGESMPNSAKTNLTVYADWGETGAGNGDKDPLGVVSYVIGFAAVGVIAVGLYYVINKKNLFKQI